MNSKIDFHVHVLHEELMEIAASHVVVNGFGAHQPDPLTPGSRREQTLRTILDPAEHICAMDQRGTDIHVLATATVIQGTFWASAEDDARYCRMMNDRIAEWVGFAPDRLIGSMVLPLQDMRASFDELDRCMEKYDLRIVHAPAAVKGTYLGDTYFDDYWRLAAERNLLTYIHPEGVEDPWFQNYSLWNSVGQPIEEAKVMASMIYSGIFDRLPDLNVIVSHGGGYLPHYYGRLDRNVYNKPDSTRNISQLPSDYLRAFFYDTCIYNCRTLDHLASIVGADRLVLGSDFPFGDADPFQIVRDSGLSDKDKDAVLNKNAKTVLQRIGALA